METTQASHDGSNTIGH